MSAISTAPSAIAASSSGDSDRTKAALQNIINFIKSERFYVSIANQYKTINLTDTVLCSHAIDSDAIILGKDLAALFNTWNQLQSSDSDMIVEARIREMVTRIDLFKEELDRFQKDATNLNIVANQVMGELESVFQNLQNQLNQEKQQIQIVEASLATAVREMNHINEQLSGSSGFWEGFKTGISFGIYSGLRHQLSKQNELRSQYNSKLLELQRTSQQTKQDAAATRQLNCILSSVSVLDTCIVSLENRINTLIALTKQTEHNGDRIIGTDNKKVAQFFQDRFNNDMTALFKWQNVFLV